MEGFMLVLVVMFFLVEATIELIKILVTKFEWEVVVAFAFGVLMTFYTGIDLFAYLEIPSAIEIPWLVVTINALFIGVLTARYSGEVNTLLDILKGLKKQLLP